MKAQKKLMDTITLDRLAKIARMPDPDEVSESISEQVADIYSQALNEGYSETEAQKFEEREQRDLYFPYWDEVRSKAERLFEAHGLTLIEKLPKKAPRDSLAWEFKVAPTKNWRDAAHHIVQTINGVGYFYFNNVDEFLESGPYTAREAVLKHLNSIADYVSVYGGMP